MSLNAETLTIIGYLVLELLLPGFAMVVPPAVVPLVSIPKPSPDDHRARDFYRRLSTPSEGAV